MINWKSCREIPKLEKSIGNWRESAPIIVWVEKEKCFAPGKYIEYGTNDGKFIASGFNGNWVITHWSEVQAPNVQAKPQTTAADDHG